MAKVKAFLEDDNSWWKILKSRSVDCCQQETPHLHGLLDGSSVTLMLLEEEADEVPRRFMTSTPKKRSDIAGPSFPTSSTTEMDYIEQDASTSNTKKCTVSSYSIDIDTKSTLIEVARHDPAEQHIKQNARSKQDNVPSASRTEAREGRDNTQRTPDQWSRRSRDTMRYVENKEKRTDRSNVVSPREIWHGQDTQTIPEDTLRSRETFSTENTGAVVRRIDFESNVDLSTELPSRNTASHQPQVARARPIKCVQHTQKLLSKITRARSRD